MTDDNLYGGGVARFPHGLLVVSAPESSDAHDEWDPASQPIHAGPDSLYISVRQAASGPVSVACVEGPYVPENVRLMFSGRINLPRASLAIYEPSGVLGLRLPIKAENNKIDIYGDDPTESSQLWIVLTRSP
jgi:hypothetical protein